jgi:hypothetical protein
VFPSSSLVTQDVHSEFHHAGASSSSLDIATIGAPPEDQHKPPQELEFVAVNPRLYFLFVEVLLACSFAPS